MRFKGLDKLKEKLPKYLGWRIVGIGLLILLAFSIALTLMVFVDSVARIFPHMTVLVLIEPILPVLGVFLCELIAFRLIWGVWHNRDRYVAEFGELAYQKAIPRGVFGVSWIFAICIHIYAPLDTLPAGTPINPITTMLSRSLLSFLGLPVGFDFTIRIVLSLIIIIIGLLTIRSALLTFGFDYMALVYLYFPAESRIQKHEIYSVIRHPTYFGLLSIAMGGLWLHFSIYSLVLFFMFLFGLLAHIFLVEEKELQDRFGESFIEYRQNVPALYIRLRDLHIYIRFLIMRETE
ncbi:MAG: isoprenylcysteine carboxylmethyltransferase family protein [Candidatus Hermodarchaeota archaeon]|nr:isoprenylcysteine carboxylmethyltransferase family protein [Candidatus Hermodarchaeota archaeon]